ncbi:patatin-like phospholipase family protein [Polyangium sp. 15x6]|uniref:patatin-like phospholipase family protein n=1 Tax=Polyangium sp. 15x6 TaxID=3042687 RepID=UPI00249BE901|nr:patatin-like phospholipase family protein [Polyangium sp. 15x6]MDI3283963.1 patatin-like phospholipase family protein [Polyangium sp. 15x6]
MSSKTTKRAGASRRKVALILSGGGARGAYEVGVLSYVLDNFARVRGAVPRIDILCGTSVGAINACFLAAHLGDATTGIRRLANLWTELDLPDVLGFGLRQAVSLPRVLLGGGKAAAGVFDVTPMAKLVEREIPWRAIARTLRRGHLGALSVSATEVASGRTVIFMQTGPDGALPTTAPPRTLIRGAHIGPLHALASAAIPILFPPVRIGRELFMDGGVRQNTPIAPAIRLGATHVFAIGLSRELTGPSTMPEDEKPPGAAFLLGKILNAFLLDHIQTDLEVMTRLNHIIEDAENTFGTEFLDKVNVSAERRGTMPYNRIHSLVVRPSEDIGRLAAEYVRRGNIHGGPAFARRMLTLVDVGEATEADLASYLLFDGAFARRLIDLGRADAEARRHDIADFFGSAAEDDEPRHAENSSWTIPPPVE